MPEYLLSVHGDDTEDMPEDFDFQSVVDAVDRFNDKVREQGYWVYANGLMPSATATVVDGTGADTVVTDGPYLEAKEHIGGFWIIDVPDLDVALALAAEGSAACQGPVEVRPMQDTPGD
jgi:hypothetical protein